jgi:hypothetical protein
VIGGGYQDTLRDLQRPQFGNIMDQFNGAMQTLAPSFGGDPYQAPGEGAAGNALGLARGEAGNTMLSNMDAREGMYRSSAGREGGLWQRNAQDQLLQQMQDAQQSYNDRLGQVRADDPWQIQNEASTLRDEFKQQQLLNSQMASDRATSKFLQDYLSGQIGGNDGRPPGSNGPGNPGPGGNPNVGSNGMPGGQSHAAIDNQGMGGQPSIQEIINQIKQMSEYSDLPAWMKQIRYRYPNRGAGEYVQDTYGDRKWDIWQGVKNNVYDLYRDTPLGGI